MFLDTSAIIAILNAEPGWELLLEKVVDAEKIYTGAHVRLETSIVFASLKSMQPEKAEEYFDDFIGKYNVTVLSLTNTIASLAVSAFQKFGKGRKTKAQLNFADCMSYAFAVHQNLPILHIGNDFTHTDLALVGRRPS